MAEWRFGLVVAGAHLTQAEMAEALEVEVSMLFGDHLLSVVAAHSLSRRVGK
jgi:hypothetical protein